MFGIVYLQYTYFMKHKTIVILIIIALGIFIDSLFGLNILDRIRGFKPESRYWEEKPTLNFLLSPGIRIRSMEISEDKAPFILKAYTTTELLSTSPQDPNLFAINENVSIVVGDGVFGTPPWLKGKIISIDKNYSDKDHPNYDLTWHQYQIAISSDSPKETIEKVKQEGGYGSIIKNNDPAMLVLPKGSIRRIDGKDYVCIVTDRTRLPQVWDAQPYAIKFRLKEIIAVPEENKVLGWTQVQGLNSTDTVVYQDYKGDGTKFDCGRP